MTHTIGVTLGYGSVSHVSEGDPRGPRSRPDRRSGGDDIVRRHVAWGPGPRAAQALMLASRARALLGGRLAPSIDDVAALARPVLRHRMALSFSARADGIVLTDVIDRLVGKIG